MLLLDATGLKSGVSGVVDELLSVHGGVGSLGEEEEGDDTWVSMRRGGLAVRRVTQHVYRAIRQTQGRTELTGAQKKRRTRGSARMNIWSSVIR